MRKTNWLRHGCNAFNKSRPTSNPLAFWTEQDILRYIKEYKLPLASVYGEIVYSCGGLLYGSCLGSYGELCTTAAIERDAYFALSAFILRKTKAALKDLNIRTRGNTSTACLAVLTIPMGYGNPQSMAWV